MKKNGDIAINHKVQIFCIKHQNSQVSLFCTKDKQLICGDCAWKDHSSHWNEVKEVTVEDLKKHSVQLIQHITKIEERLVQEKNFNGKCQDIQKSLSSEEVYSGLTSSEEFVLKFIDDQDIIQGIKQMFALNSQQEGLKHQKDQEEEKMKFSEQ